MSEPGHDREPPVSRRAADFDETPINPAEVDSAGRSCSAIIILVAILLLVVCVALAWRYTVIH